MTVRSFNLYATAEIAWQQFRMIIYFQIFLLHYASWAFLYFTAACEIPSLFPYFINLFSITQKPMGSYSPFNPDFPDFDIAEKKQNYSCKTS